MNLDWLQSFTQAAKQKSFSKAASVNNISQPALSKQIQNLESSLNVRLFHRTPTGITLTEAGQYFYNRIVPIMTELTVIRSDLQTFCRSTPVAIGSLPSLATYYLPLRMKGFKFMDRSVSLMLQNTSSELLHSLREGRLDAVFIETEHTLDSLWRYELFKEPYYALFSLDHKYRSKNSVKLRELCEEPFITHQAPCDLRNHIIHQIELIGYKPNIVSEVTFGDFIYGSVASGIGITIIPELLAKNINHPNLFSLPIVDFGRKRTISLITRDKNLGSTLYQYIKRPDQTDHTF
ncbi:LysR family transcriptional regulator [Bacillus massilinigeriensis]|uniref:LysR family transcriptional regulator n=1 Tax=Bacillus mediterraneensis TaxID=1805474 RepID=UPI0008F8C8BB|nr:LysR family transcriptional regulator [Bacillus mediterraneensis]